MRRHTKLLLADAIQAQYVCVVCTTNVIHAQYVQDLNVWYIPALVKISII